MPFEQASVEVSAALVTDAWAFELVEPREGPLDYPSGAAEAGTMWSASTCDDGPDAALPQQTAVLLGQ